MASIVAIIQARMGSTRLPGKVLLPLAGHPVLWQVCDRLSHSRLITQCVVATSIEPQDDVISEFCKAQGINCFRGSESDVLGRYYLAAKQYQAEVIVRITADCPLIDPQVTDRVIGCYLENRTGYVGASNVIKRTFPRGLDTEVISFLALEQAHDAVTDSSLREHVSLVMYRQPGAYKLASVENLEDLSGYRWTLDEPADLSLISEIYQRLYSHGKIFLMSDVIALIKQNPHLAEMNKDIKQKA